MNQLNNEWEVEKEKIKKIFNQIAPYYQQYAELMQVVGDDMLENLSFLTIEPQKIVDLGCGAGFFIPKLQSLYPAAKIIAIDNADEMLKNISGAASIVHADAENIALPTQSVDVIFANLLLPWSMNPVVVIQECYRILKPGGVCFFSSFGPDTFKELIEHQIFPDMHHIGDALIKAHFVDPVMEAQFIELQYKNTEQMQQEFSMTGLNYFLPGVNIQSPVTFEVVYGHAWKPNKQGQALLDEHGVARVNVAEIPVRKRHL